MKKLTVRVIILFFIILIVSIITRASSSSETKVSGRTIPVPTPVVEEKDPLLNTIDIMTVEEKIGSLLILGFKGTEISTHITTLIRDHHVGGINLLKWNILNAEQTKKLNADLQKLYQDKHIYPFIIAVDQEGGTVVRFTFLNEKTSQPNIKTVEQATRVAEMRALELQSLGVNMNFAPVVDYITDKRSYLYNRTFATTTDGTIALGQAMADAYLKHGIMPVFKHFPGYGNSTIDPHKANTTFNGTREMFKDNLTVFRALLGNKKQIPVMTAHIVIPWISDLPATKSKALMTEVLRDDFSYEGVVITDDLDMASVGSDAGQNAVDSILAGADMIISTPNDANHFIIIEALKKAVADGTISEDRLDQSVYRVLKMRQNLDK